MDSNSPHSQAQATGDAPDPRFTPGPGGSWRQPDMRYAERSRAEDLRVHRPSAQRSDGAGADAISQGRRVYLGNVVYQAKPADIEEFLAANQFSAADKIHVSVDPISGRNPGYCFVEFTDRETADSAIEQLNGQILLGREVKCRPCLPKGTSNRPQGNQREANSESGFNRWGDWQGGRNNDQAREGGQRRGMHDALRHYETAASDGKQLYVGGLPRMMDQAMHEEEIRSIFQGFQVEAVGKRITPKQQQQQQQQSFGSNSDRRNFCFVDFATTEDAQAALDALDGSMYREAPLRVSMARGKRND